MVHNPTSLYQFQPPLSRQTNSQFTACPPEEQEEGMVSKGTSAVSDCTTKYTTIRLRQIMVSWGENGEEKKITHHRKDSRESPTYYRATLNLSHPQCGPSNSPLPTQSNLNTLPMWPH